MKLSRRALLFLTLTSGCSGGSSPSPPTGVVFALDWPDASRTLPLAANSVRVQIKQGSKLLIERVYTAGADSEEQLMGLPFATALTLEATAYTTTDGTGSVLATASVPFSVLKGKLERLTLTLSSVIQQVIIGSTSTEGTTELTATARDSAGSVLLTAPSQWTWATSAPALGTLTPQGATAHFVESGFGVTTLTATESESGKSASVVRPVCRGIPTTVTPDRAIFPLSGPITSLYPVGDGRFVVAHGSILACIDGTGALLWQRSIPFTGGTVQGIFGDYLVLSQSTLPAVRIHRLSDGGSFWQEAQALQGKVLGDGLETLYLSFGTGIDRRLEARHVTLGTVLWSQPFAGGELCQREGTSLIRLSATDSSYAAFHTSLGHVLWESRVPGGSVFLGGRSGSPGILFSLSPGELRALYTTSGVRVWATSTSGDSMGALTQDGQTLVLQGATQCGGYAAGTGTVLWTRTELPLLSTGVLLALPPVVVPGCQALQALQPTSGASAWTTYLPAGHTTLQSQGSRVLVSRGSELYALDTASGAYLWGLTNPGSEPAVVSGGVVAIEERSASRLHLLRSLE